MNRYVIAFGIALAACGCTPSCEAPAPGGSPDASEPRAPAATAAPANPNRARLEAEEVARAAQALDADQLQRFAAYQRGLLAVRRRIATDVPDPAERAAVLRRKLPRAELEAASLEAGIDGRRLTGLRLLTDEYYAAREESWRAARALGAVQERIAAARKRNEAVRPDDEALEAAAASADARFQAFRKDAELRWGAAAVALLERFADAFLEVRTADVLDRRAGRPR